MQGEAEKKAAAHPKKLKPREYSETSLDAKQNYPCLASSGPWLERDHHLLMAVPRTELLSNRHHERSGVATQSEAHANRVLVVQAVL